MRESSERTPRPAVTIALAVGDSALASSIKRKLDEDERLEIVGEATTAPTLLDLASAAEPGVVLLDPAAIDVDGEFIGRLRDAHPQSAVVVIVDVEATPPRIPRGATTYWAPRARDTVESLLEVSAIARLLERRTAAAAQQRG